MIVNVSMLIIASHGECPPARRVWGTGGWLPPAERPPEGREALDWLTLARLSGWGASVVRASESFEGDAASGARWIVVACDPDDVGEERVAWLASRLARERVLVVARAPRDAGGAFARLCGVRRGEGTAFGRELRWTGRGAGRSWHCRNVFEAGAIELTEGAEVWATLDGAPVVAARAVGRGAVVTLAFHPSAARDVEGSFTALLRLLLARGARAPVALYDWDGCLVLRMDDPGGAQNVHSRDWYYSKLGEREWAAVGEELGRRSARLSVGYTPGWVDDGDARRGRLTISDASALARRSVVTQREPGRVYASPQVVYEDTAGHSPGTRHDYVSEFRGIRTLCAARLASVELHGYTHVHPDAAAWAVASDRYESFAWYRELGRGAAAALAARRDEEHPLALGVGALEDFFGARPTTLICPGDEWTEEVIERALDLQFIFVSDYHLAIRAGGRFCWTSHVSSPYLDESGAQWFDAGLPVVGYFHDREPSLEGVGWMARRLDEWAAAGGRRFIDFRELAATVGRVLRLEEEAGGEFVLTVKADEHAPPLVRPLEVVLHFPAGESPRRVLVRHEGEEFYSEVVWAAGDEGAGRVIVRP